MLYLSKESTSKDRMSTFQCFSNGKFLFKDSKFQKFSCSKGQKIEAFRSSTITRRRQQKRITHAFRKGTSNDTIWPLSDLIKKKGGSKSNLIKFWNFWRRKNVYRVFEKYCVNIVHRIRRARTHKKWLRIEVNIVFHSNTSLRCGIGKIELELAQ